MKIDVFPHIFPKSFFDRMVEVAPDKNAIKRWLHIPVLWDLDARLRVMDEFGDYQQILTLSLPSIESLGPPEATPELARLANDGMAEIAKKHPDRFPAWVASLPLNNVPACLEEITRAIEHLDAKGIQIFTNVNGRPLDDPEFAPIFDKMHQYDLPIWMHPTRGPSMKDYASEDRSKFEIWWLFGCLMRPARPWPEWSSRASSIAGRVLRSSRITWARWCRISMRASVLAWINLDRAPRMSTIRPLFGTWRRKESDQSTISTTSTRTHR
jgi:predicted TIM-barrel fold metal-dependent hydrolase